MKLKLGLCFLINLLAVSLFSQNVTKYDSDFKFGIVEHLGEKISEDIYLINEKGETVNLIDLIDKPTAIVFVYFKCPGICSPLLDGLAGLINTSDLEISKDYQVLSISFDPTETTDLAVQKKKKYQSLIQEKIQTKVGFFLRLTV
jgi:protein SCO1/2